MVYCRFCELMNKQEENNTGSNGKAQSGLRSRCGVKRPHGKRKRKINIAITWVYLYYWDFFHCFIYSCPLSDLLPSAAQSPFWTPKGHRWRTCHLCRKAIIREFPSPFITSSSAILSWIFLPLKKCLQTSLLCVCSFPFNWSLRWFQLNYRH